MGSPNSCEHDVPGPEVHTVRGRKGRDPLQPDAVQMINTVSSCFPGSCMLWPLPAIFSSQHSSHTHPASLPCPLHHTPEAMNYLQVLGQASLSCLQVFILPRILTSFLPCLLTPSPTSLPETPTSPSSLNVDVPLPRNPSLYPKDWWDAHLHVLLCSKPLSQHHRVFNCLSTYWSLPLDNIDNFQEIKNDVYHDISTAHCRSPIKIHERSDGEWMRSYNLCWAYSGPSKLDPTQWGEGQSAEEEDCSNQCRGHCSTSAKLFTQERLHLWGQLTLPRKGSQVRE